MKVFVCIKQVPGISDVKINSKTGTLIRDGVPSIINPLDKHALELALKIKEEKDAEVIAISMGPPQAEEALREALATGSDRAFLLTDKKFAGADTLATSHTLALAIKKILDDFDKDEKFLIICGACAIDGDTAQVGVELAEELNIPQITYVQKIQINNSKIIAEKVLRPEEILVLESKLPVLITVLKELNTPRFPTIAGIVEAYEEKEITYLDAQSLKADEKKIGLNGSQTQVWKIFTPQRNGDHIKLSGDIGEMVKNLCQNLVESKIL
ncbi:MAG: electron transfer flavoprotein subunit beta/FixA family protein [Candidatus Helarchaeota archaeon]|nr:electron transfer flavoprotein subunit beta/FixA family protein [Candidatus Helarchaeota archaeon]